jgi:hypothetical protein
MEVFTAKDPTRPHGGTYIHYVAAIGQVDLTVEHVLTRATRLGLAARLGGSVNL